MLKIIYFASLKEKIGRSEDQIELPEGVSTLSDLIDSLSESLDDTWSSAINSSTTLMAVNQEMSDSNTLIKDGDEIAFFPPVTGG